MKDVVGGGWIGLMILKLNNKYMEEYVPTFKFEKAPRSGKGYGFWRRIYLVFIS